MSNITYTFKVCDICGSDIDRVHRNYGDHLWCDSAIGNYQTFSLPDGDKVETCRQCCNAIKFAFAFLDVEYDDSMLWLRAGFKKAESGWVKNE